MSKRNSLGRRREGDATRCMQGAVGITSVCGSSGTNCTRSRSIGGHGEGLCRPRCATLSPTSLFNSIDPQCTVAELPSVYLNFQGDAYNDAVRCLTWVAGGPLQRMSQGGALGGEVDRFFSFKRLGFTGRLTENDILVRKHPVPGGCYNINNR